MRGISATSLAEVLAAVDAAKGSAGDLGAQLFEVVAVLDGAPALRRVLTDPSTEADAKVGLATQVFGSKVGKDTLAVVSAAVSGRWASSRDLTDGLETAGVVATVSGTDDLDALESQLFEVDRIIRSSAELRQAVSDRSKPAAGKASLLADLFGGKVDAGVLSLVTQASVARTGSFESVLASFADTAAAHRGRTVAEVRVAEPLSDASRTRLAAALAARYGREVQLNVVVDPAVLGGIAVSVGGEVIDGSMSTRLETARRRLAG